MRHHTSCIVALLVLLAGTVAHADLRSEAMAMLARLRQDGMATRFPEELRSLDATVATGELYYQLSDQPKAAHYYRLAAQKGALLERHLMKARLGSNTVVPLPTDAPRQTTLPVPQSSAATAGQSSLSAVAQPPDAQHDAGTAEHASISVPSDPASSHIHSTKLVGAIGTYTVHKRDTLRLIAGKLGVSISRLTAMNGLSLRSRLKPGQLLRFNNQRIIPTSNIRDGIVINIPDRMLYLFQKGKVAYATAVALGTPTKMDNIPWQTPTGKFKIIAKIKDPTWTVPPSIQEELRREGKEVITSIPPGDDNPLGRYALRTSLPGILIHSTSSPWSIYTYASHGCIRVYPERMATLFRMVPLNSPGEIIYHPVKAAVTADGRILLEVHGDIYDKTRGIMHEAKALLRSMRVTEKVDWSKVKQVVARRSGVAEEVTRETTESRHVQPVVTHDQSPS